MQNFRPTIEKLKEIYRELEKKDISVKALKEAINNLESHLSNIEKVEDNIFAIRQEVIDPVKKEFKKSGKFSVLFGTIGVVGTIITLIPTFTDLSNFKLFSINSSEKVINTPVLSLSNILSNLNSDYDQITQLVPNLYEFDDGDSGSNISDGGNDMYDGGNILKTNLGDTEIPYSNDAILSSNLLGEDGKYFTRKYPGLFIFAADIDSVNTFKIQGGLGADTNGTANGSQLAFVRNRKNYIGFVKRVFNSGKPSVNHLIILEYTEGIGQSFPSNTDLDQHIISNISEGKRIYYLLFSTRDSSYISDTTMQSIMLAFIELAESVNPKTS